MSRNIKLRRIIEITFSTVSIVFSLEILFSLMYLFAIHNGSSENFIRTIVKIQNSTGITTAFVNIVLFIFSIIIAIKDKAFPYKVFFLSLLELLISILLVIVTNALDMAFYNGVSIQI